MRHKVIPILAVLTVSLAMLAGLAYLLQQHAQQPDSYPEFSSFRTLPEGTSILYDALGRAPGMAAERNIKPLGTLRFTGATMLFLGIEPASLNGNFQWFSEIEQLAAKGNRLIVGLLPRRHRFIQGDENQITDALKRWRVRLAFVRQTDFRDEEEDKLVAGWPMYFAESHGWDATRMEDGRAVVIQRANGKGSIVLLANPYLLSNAAIIDDRQTAFLAGLVGSSDQAIFDETHFGMEETGSIAALARRYRLQGLLLGLAITAGLFSWKSAAGFPPPAAPRTPMAAAVVGEDSAATFLNLLRRNIRRDDILSICVQEWRKMQKPKTGVNLQAAIDLAERGRKAPASTYAQIQQVLCATHKPGPDGAEHNQS